MGDLQGDMSETNEGAQRRSDHYGYHYAVTIKGYAKKPKTEAELYAKMIKVLPRHTKVMDHTYEYDKKGTLHLHALVLSCGCELEPIKPLRYWHIYCAQVINWRKYIKYMHKQDDTLSDLIDYEQEERLATEYFRNAPPLFDMLDSSGVTV